MNQLIATLAFFLTLLLCCTAEAAPYYTSHIGYAYPAGGQIGHTFEVTIGGKGIKGARQVLVSGDGVEVEIIRHINAYQNRLTEQIRLMKRERFAPNAKKRREPRFGPAPDHPNFNVWKSYSNSDFREMEQKYLKKAMVQRNREIDELLWVRVKVAKDAQPGLRQLRVLTKRGLSNPIRFMLGTLPEVYEQEPNDRLVTLKESLKPPFVINGQIVPGDIDHFRFQAEKGQKLVIQVRARELVPFLADAVPGWFQAVIKLQNSQGEELAFADDYRFNPDPVLYFEVPESGEYSLMLHDSIYRGREDFVYRISVGEFPFVTSFYPLGGRKGQVTTVNLKGWNLPYSEVQLNPQATAIGIVSESLIQDDKLSNSLKYDLEQLPEAFEKRQNDNFTQAQHLSIPVVVNGRIEKRGDTDFYRFEATERQQIEVETVARRVGSPVDSVLRLFDENRALLQISDDATVGPNIGTLTHHADSRLSYKVPRSGRYYLQVADSQSQGGSEYGYRLKLSHAQADFELYALPSALSIQRGGTQVVTFHVIRKNGFNGEIELKATDLPKGVELSGNRIPAGVSKIDTVLKAAKKVAWGEQRINFSGAAFINKKRVTRYATPADAQTQAFITHHLVTADETRLLVDKGRRFIANIKMPESRGLTLLAGQSNSFMIRYPAPEKAQMSVELRDAPKGISLQVERMENHLKFILTATSELEKGLKGNLIFEVFNQMKAKKPKDKKREIKYSAGVLPAVPFEVI